MSPLDGVPLAAVNLPGSCNRSRLQSSWTLGARVLIKGPMT
jgi:hypothetical protein